MSINSQNIIAIVERVRIREIYNKLLDSLQQVDGNYGGQGTHGTLLAFYQTAARQQACEVL